MRKVSERYKELATRKGRYPLIKIELYEGTRGAWSNNVSSVLTGTNNIKNASLTIGITSQPDKFETGVALSGEFRALLTGNYGSVRYSQKIKVYAGFKDIENDSEEYVSLGVFYIESKMIQSDGLNIVARDLMMYAETSYIPQRLTYPCTLTELYKDIVADMGGEIADDYTLPVEAIVLEAPFTCTSSDVIYVKGETQLDGKPYTRRQALAQIAKTQLGNVFFNGDGQPTFYSYNGIGEVCDDNITDLSIGEDSYQNLGVFYAYGDRTQKQIKDEETFGTIVFFTTLPIQDLSGEHYEQLKEQARRACGWWWKEGRITRKGIGDVEPGDRIDYSGKHGNINFFVSGIVMEWSNGSFDETIYSFAPTYESTACSSVNTDTAPSETEDKLEDVEENSGKKYSAGKGISITKGEENDVISVNIDNDTITFDSGKLKSNSKVATTDTVGVVKPDGKTIQIADDGTLSLILSESSGGVSVGNLVMIDHAPTAADLTGGNCVIVQYNPESTALIEGETSSLFSATAVFVEVGSGESEPETPETPNPDGGYVCSSADELLFEITGAGYGTRQYKKKNDGIAYCAYYYTNNSSHWFIPVLISETEDAVKYYSTYNNASQGPSGSFEYNGKTLFYNTVGNYSFGNYVEDKSGLGRHKLSQEYAQGSLEPALELAAIIYG